MQPLPHVLWNLFLAIIPVLLAFAVARGARDDLAKNKRIRWLIWAPLLMVWLAFLPNTAYLLTEWRHYLASIARDPQSYWNAQHDSEALLDFLLLSVFYSAYSASGFVTFFLAIWPLDRLAKTPWWVKALFFGLCSLGVYLGLVDRFNSWQVVRHLQPIVQSAMQALSRPHLVLLMAAFALFLWVAYGVFGLLMEGLALRYKMFRSK